MSPPFIDFVEAMRRGELHTDLFREWAETRGVAVDRAVVADWALEGRSLTREILDVLEPNWLEVLWDFEMRGFIRNDVVVNPSPLASLAGGYRTMMARRSSIDLQETEFVSQLRMDPYTTFNYVMWVPPTEVTTALRSLGCSVAPNVYRAMGHYTIYSHKLPAEFGRWALWRLGFTVPPRHPRVSYSHLDDTQILHLMMSKQAKDEALKKLAEQFLPIKPIAVVEDECGDLPAEEK